jgi:hypothetical protein
MVCFSSSVPPVCVLGEILIQSPMAARLMLSGAGNPVRPRQNRRHGRLRRRRSASAATFIVEDTLISEILDASSAQFASVTLLRFNHAPAPAASFAPTRRQFAHAPSLNTSLTSRDET